MEKKKHGEEYEETRDGAITYLNQDMNDDVISAYQKSKDIDIRQKISVIINQRNSKRVEFVRSIEEFDALKTSIENDIAGTKSTNANTVNVTSNIDVQGSGEAVIDVEGDDDFEGKNSNNDGTDSNSTEDSKKDDKAVDTKIKDLEEKAKEMEAMQEDLLGSENSLKGMKSSFMKDSNAAGIMLDARLAYEQAQDKLNYETAKHMVQKNVLVAKREAVILEINQAIGRGEDLSGLQDQLIDLNDRIDTLDKNFENVFPLLQAEVRDAHQGLDLAKKEEEKTVKADFRNSYKQVMQYGDDGILKGESVDMNKNLHRIGMATKYNDNILSNGKKGAIEAQTINIEGQVVRVVSQETSKGVDTSFMDGNVTQMETGVGKNNTYVTRGSDGSLVASNPGLQDSFDRIGIQNVDDIGAACEEMDEKAAKREKEELEEEQEYPTQSLYYDSDND